VDEIVKAVFLDARQAHERSRRAAAVGVLALVFVHITFFSQHLEVSRTMRGLGDDRERLDQAQEVATALVTDLTGLEELTTGQATRSAERAAATLVGQFEDLQMAVDMALIPLPGADEPETELEPGTALDALRGRSDLSVSTIQQPQLEDDRVQRRMVQQPLDERDMVQSALVETPPGQGPFAMLDETTLRGLRAADGIEEIRAVLAPHIRIRLVTPLFDELNGTWREQQAPKIERAAEALTVRIAEGRTAYPEATAVWTELADKAGDVKALAAGAAFQPPDGDVWWHTTGGKLVEMRLVGRSASAELAEAIGSLGVPRRLGDRIEAARVEVGRLQVAAESARVELEEAFAVQRERLTEFSQLFALVAVDLNSFVSHFPLLLGVGAALMMLWQGQRERDLAVATTAVFATLRDASPTTRRLLRTSDATGPRALLPALACAGAVAWIAIASTELWTHGERAGGAAVRIALAGITFVTMATVYWIAIRRPGDPGEGTPGTVGGSEPAAARTQNIPALPTTETPHVQNA